jgi:hypothetical protein
MESRGADVGFHVGAGPDGQPSWRPMPLKWKRVAELRPHHPGLNGEHAVNTVTRVGLIGLGAMGAGIRPGGRLRRGGGAGGQCRADRRRAVRRGRPGAAPAARQRGRHLGHRRPGAAAAVGKRLLAERGLHLIDGPVSGGAKKAADGQMTVMASGRPEAFAAAGGRWTRSPARSTAWATRPARAAR